MDQFIMVACDLHAKTMVLKIAQGRGPGELRTLPNTPAARRALIELLRERSEAAGAEVVFAYEASSLGFGLYDELTDAGIRCHVLAPTKIARSQQQRRRKTDTKDAEQILELLRAHVLAGNSLPNVWVPDVETRDDRELVRARLDVSHKLAATKAQMKGLLKRCHLDRPSGVGKGWTKKFLAWLRGLAGDESPLAHGTRTALTSLLEQHAFLEEQETNFDERLQELALTRRYVKAFYALLELTGVGLVTAMVYLTELGDLSRFKNRRQLAAYLGLVPSSHESGERADRKGHITRQGPGRVRQVLCQAAWIRVRRHEGERIVYQRLAVRNPKHKKIAVVASMRRLAIRMWHAARKAQAAEPGGQATTGGGTRVPSSLPRTPTPFPLSVVPGGGGMSLT